MLTTTAAGCLRISFLSALDFRAWLGGEKAINAYCHDLALRGGRRLAELLGTELMDPEGEFTANMVRLLYMNPTSSYRAIPLLFNPAATPHTLCFK